MTCGALQPDQAFRNETPANCKACGKRLKAFLLPSLYQNLLAPPPLPAEPPQPGEAVCFYDSNRRATKSCSHCGVFISDNWAALWGSETVCLKCLGDLRKKGEDKRFQASRTLWDNITLTLSLGPWFIAVLLLLTIVGYMFSAMALMLTLFTAPIAIFVGLRHWNAPRSLVPRSRLRLVSGVVFAVLQVILWVGGIIAIIYAINDESLF